MKALKHLIFKSHEESSEYENYRGLAYMPSVKFQGETEKDKLEEKAHEILEWAKKNGALFYTFLSFPLTGGIIEKHETFLDLHYFFKNSLNNEG